MGVNGRHTHDTSPHGGFVDPILVNRFVEAVNNETSMRRQFSKFSDDRRDIESECGYPETPTLGSAEQYRDLFDREPIATRICELLPKECWQVQPSVKENDKHKNTEFEAAWDKLGQQLRGEQCWYQDEQGSPVWEKLRRADIRSGIGHFGVILLGIDDGKTLDQPVEGVVKVQKVGNQLREVHNSFIRNVGRKRVSYPTKPEPWPYAEERVRNEEAAYNAAAKWDAGTEARYDTQDYSSGMGTDAQYVGVQLSPPQHPADKPSKEQRELLFLRVYDESLIQIVQYESELRNPRFGHPVMYRITLNDPREQHAGIGLPIATVRVHWSRVIHLADNLGNSEVFGVPRLRPVLNPVFDIKKVRGAGAEGYWRSCFTGTSLETHPALGGDVEIDKQSIKDMMENYYNGLDRTIVTRGMTAKQLAPSIVDPTTQLDGLIKAICIQLGCPLRVFMGSERGELASGQDDASWNDRLRERQNGYITPRIIVPFIDRMISAGVLPEPEGYSVEWPDLDSLTGKDKAGIAQQMTAALASYVSGGVENILPLKAFYIHIVGLDEEQAQAIIDEAAVAEDMHTPPEEPPQEVANEALRDALGRFAHDPAGAIGSAFQKAIKVSQAAVDRIAPALKAALSDTAADIVPAHMDTVAEAAGTALKQMSMTMGGAAVEALEHATIYRFRQLRDKFGTKGAIAVMGASTVCAAGAMYLAPGSGLHFAAAAVPLGIASGVRAFREHLATHNASGDMVQAVKDTLHEAYRSVGLEPPPVSDREVREALDRFLPVTNEIHRDAHGRFAESDESLEEIGHEAHVGHEALEFLEHGEWKGLAASYANKASMYAFRAMQRVPGLRTAGEKLAEVHDKLNEGAEHLMKGLSDRYGASTTSAIVGASLVAVPGSAAAMAVPGGKLLVSLPGLAVAEAGYRLGLVGPHSKIEAGLAKVSGAVHGIRQAVGRAVSATGRGITDAGRGVASSLFTMNAEVDLLAELAKLLPAEGIEGLDELLEDSVHNVHEQELL